jgi:hypothetical protein
MLDGVKTWLGSARARWIMLVVSTILVLPSAGPRLVFDDHLQALMRTADSRVMGMPYAPFDLFAFARPGPLNDMLIDRGMLLPWWTDRQLLIAFFRPLASLTHVVDGWLWPHSPRMMHLHSVAWYAVLLGTVSAVYRRFVVPAWLAGAAFFLYAIDDTHGATVSWIANRNAILASIFGLLALLFHDRWRRERTTLAAALATGSLAVGLLAGEAAVGACAYIGAYAIFLDRADRKSRQLSLLPYAAIVLGWRMAYQWLGYGARGSDAYLDPGREPAAFFARLPQTIAMLVQGQFGIFSADLWFWSPSQAVPFLVAAGIVTSVVIFALLYPLLKADVMARFWAAGAVGSLVPSASSIPGDRLLLLAGVGSMALLAQLMTTFLERRPPFPVHGIRRALIAVPLAVIFVRRVVAAPLMLPVRAHSMDAVGRLADFAADAVKLTPHSAGRTIVVLNPPANVLASYLSLTLATRGEVVPEHVRWLAPTDSELTVTRLSERILRVRPARGFFSHWTDRLYRSERNPLRTGERVDLRDVRVTIGPLTSQGTPAEAEFHFREPLESPHYLWLRWEGERCVPSEPPRIGETVVFPPTDFAAMLFDNVIKSLFRPDT